MKWVDRPTLVSVAAELQRLGSVALVVAFSACGGSGESGLAADFTVRDSAGVRIVEYEGTPAPTHSIALSEPLYRHGYREGDYLFTLRAAVYSWTASGESCRKSCAIPSSRRS